MKTVMIGAGNVAEHLSRAFQHAGFNIVQVYSRTETSAKALAATLRAPFITDIQGIVTDAELYVIAVSDDAIPSVISGMPSVGGLVVHTAGSVGIDVLTVKFKNCGVLYPLQTFTRGHPVDFAQVAVLTEGNPDVAAQQISSIAGAISPMVYAATSSQRMMLHLAAVFGCNFANHLWHIAAEISQQAGFTLDVLQPLICETARKAFAAANPKDVQTGPAMRNDIRVMQRHYALLTNNRTEWSDIYALMSRSIANTKTTD